MANRPGETTRAYRVLARRWRPAKLADLVGQDVLVRTLTNALTSQKLAHAFLLSGIRGIGKTTTARIMARSLNCTGADGDGGPTPEPCGFCPSCVAMNENKSIDVMEMDAATRTGINDIREIVDSVRYGPAASRYKIFIIDEVHMLSLQAFNGLLKTLEEPPAYVKFIFATTEIRKLPVTILSRCQRFDLKRVETPVLSAHYGRIADAESIAISADALTLIARAAQGSVRDGLSLLDQARVLSGNPDADGSNIEAGQIAEDGVREMLGLSEQGVPLEFLENIASGSIKPLLERYRGLCANGADPAAFLQDLMDLIHALSCMKAAPKAIPENAAWIAKDARAKRLVGKLTIGHFARLWQMMLKGLEELRLAGDRDQAVEMVLLRAAFAADMPPPGELIKMLGSDGPTQPTLSGMPGEAVGQDTGGPPEPRAAVRLDKLEDVVALLYGSGDKMLAAMIERYARLIRFEQDRIELCQTEGPADLAGRLSSRLLELTGRRWIVVIGSESSEPTLAEQAEQHQKARLQALSKRPDVQALLTRFPGARLVEVRQTRRKAEGGMIGQSSETCKVNERYQ